MNLFNFGIQNNDEAVVKKAVKCEDCGKLTPPIYISYGLGGLKPYICADCYKKHKRYRFLVLVAFLIAIPVMFIIIVLLLKFNIL